MKASYCTAAANCGTPVVRGRFFPSVAESARFEAVRLVSGIVLSAGKMTSSSTALRACRGAARRGSEESLADFCLPMAEALHRLGFHSGNHLFRGFLEHDSPMEDEHRIANRQRVLKAGKIEFGGGAIDCTVRNISATGAALDVTSPLGIPAQFTLVTQGSHLPCRVVWRKEKRIGIAFDQRQ